MTRPRRLLVVSPFFPDSESDGHGIAWRQSASALAGEGLEVTVLVLKTWRPVRRSTRLARRRMDHRLLLADPPLRIVRRTYPGVPRNRLPELSLLLLRLVAGSHVLAQLRRPHDAVLVHTDRLGFAADRPLRDHRCVRLLRLHAFDVTPEIMRTHHRGSRTPQVFATFDGVLAVGTPILRKLESRYGELPLLSVLPQAIDVDALPAPAPARGPVLRIVSASVLSEGKAVQDSLAALASLRDSGRSEWRFSVFGDGPFKPDLARAIRELGLSDHVELRGWLPHDELMRELALADVFLLPSRHEAFGVAHLEAMALGCAVVGPRGEGPSDFIRHGETGYLVDPGDIAGIQSVLRELVDNPAGLAAVQDRAVESARGHHSWRHYARTLRELITTDT